MDHCEKIGARVPYTEFVCDFKIRQNSDYNVEFLLVKIVKFFETYLVLCHSEH